MANLLKAIGDGLWDSIESPMRVVESVVKGDFGEAWDKLKAIPGNQEDHNSEIFNAAGIRGWVGDHPGETVGAAIGAFLGGSALLGSGGAAAGGSTGGVIGGGAGAPVSAAVGMTPGEAIIAGGGSASEVGSVAAGVDWGDLAKRGVKALSNSQKEQQSQQSNQQTSFGRSGANHGTGGAQGINTQDDYANAMQDLTNKYGQFMFNNKF